MQESDASRPAEFDGDATLREWTCKKCQAFNRDFRVNCIRDGCPGVTPVSPAPPGLKDKVYTPVILNILIIQTIYKRCIMTPPLLL